MSGRSGFRKTRVRRAKRPPPHLRGDWTLTVRKQDHGLWLLGSGPTNTLGVRVTVTGEIVASGKCKAWVIRQMTDYLAGLGITTVLPKPKRAQPIGTS